MWAISLLEKKRKFLLVGMGTVLVLLILSLAYWQLDLQIDIEQVFALLVLSVMLFILLSLSFFPVQYLTKSTKYILLLLVFFSGAIYIPLLFDPLMHPVAELVFSYSFFLTYTAVGVYFVYAAKFPKKQKDVSQAVSFDEFLQLYEITSRESEVIMEIYKGKTNQEIADTLFVTLQTIKDHTHRIYLKTQVKNRTQLASLLRRFERQVP
jgi:DNA-binding CsgD family transcriptional regulator